jgi:hypothetical protein
MKCNTQTDSNLNCVKFEVLTAMTTKSNILWVVIPCSLVVVQHFTAMHCLHLQSQRVSEAKQSARSKWETELANFSDPWTLHRVASPHRKTYAEFVFFVTMKRTACLAEDVGSTYL